MKITNIFVIFILFFSWTLCANEYTFIKSILDQYKRPFTLLELCPYPKHYSTFFSPKYPDSAFIMLEKSINTEKILNKVTEKNKNTILLSIDISKKNIKRLHQCEHFDVLLLHNIKNNFNKNWKIFLEYFCCMADNIVIEISHQNQKNIQKIEAYMETKNIGKICKKETTEASTFLWVITTTEKRLKRILWIFPSASKRNKYFIKSNFKNKTLIKKFSNKTKTSPWIPGINLITFKMLHGVYPNKETVKKKIESLKTIKHNDWLPNNMVISGTNIQLIDFNDKRNIPYTEKHLRQTFELISMDIPEEIKKFFFEVIVGAKYIIWKQNYIKNNGWH